MAFEGLSDKLSGIFKKLRTKGKLSEKDIKETMREVRLALLEADVNYKVAKDFVANVSAMSMGAQVMESLTPAQQVIKIVNDELCVLMGTENARINFSSKPPTVILMVGLQGSGKTTHSGKLALHFKNQGKRVLLCACDVYRPAAIQQLMIIGEKAGVPVFEMGQDDPVQIALKALARARDYGDDILIIDTAGRLHIDDELMDELSAIKAAVNPDEILLVVDAMTGQDAVNAAQGFNDALGIDGVILTKLDGDTRGGAALSVRAVTGKPIKFAGTGEKLEDLEPFHPDRMAQRILGMGDVMTFIEKAQTAIDMKSAEQLEKKLRENKFDLNDLLDQFSQVKKMGNFTQLIEMLPGGNKVKEEDAQQGAVQLKRFEAILLSMTPHERENPSVINPARKRRIAAGSGTKVEDVNKLLRQYEQTRKMIKQFSGKGAKKRFNRRFGGMPGMM